MATRLIEAAGQCPLFERRARRGTFVLHFLFQRCS
jgi:hypothetical protein